MLRRRHCLSDQWRDNGNSERQWRRRQAPLVGSFCRPTSSIRPSMRPASGRHRFEAATGSRPMPDAGVIVDIEVVTGEEADFARMAERLDALEITLGRRPGTVTADKAYGIGKVYAALAHLDITAVIPPRPSTRPGKAKGFLVERFRYDAMHDVVRCPRRRLMPPRSTTKTGRWFRADRTACQTCPLRARLAFRMAGRRVGSISPSTMLTFCARGANVWYGATPKPTSPPVTAGWSKVCTGWPRPCTAWPEPPGAVSKT